VIDDAREEHPVRQIRRQARAQPGEVRRGIREGERVAHRLERGLDARWIGRPQPAAFEEDLPRLPCQRRGELDRDGIARAGRLHLEPAPRPLDHRSPRRDDGVAVLGAEAERVDEREVDDRRVEGIERRGR
jgi:hypothetical protein